MKNAAIVISCILLVVAVGQTDVHGAILLVPDMTLDAQTNVYGSGITPLVPVTFQVQENHASSDSLSVRAIGQIDLAVSWANYDVNAAGIFFHSAQPVIAGTTGYHCFASAGH